MESLHKKNSYNTPDNTKRVFLDKLFLGTSLYFIFGCIKVVLSGQIIAKRGKYTTKELEKSSFNTLKYIEKCGGKIHIENLNYVKKLEEPVVFVSNHMSTLETFAFPYIISPIRKIGFIVKESLIKHPF